MLEAIVDCVAGILEEEKKRQAGVAYRNIHLKAGEIATLLDRPTRSVARVMRENPHLFERAGKSKSHRITLEDLTEWLKFAGRPVGSAKTARGGSLDRTGIKSASIPNRVHINTARR